MHRDLLRLLEQLRAGEFRELAGSRLSVRLAIADSLINRALTDAFASRGGRIREFRLRPLEGNRAIVHLRLARPAFLPAIAIEVQTYRQPAFPGEPALILRWTSLPGVAALASFAARFFDVLPPGTRMMGELIAIDLRVLLAERGFADLLPLIDRAEVGTQPGAIVVTLDVNVR